jgi:hypothetical protein
VPRANVAAQHEGRSPIGPALKNIRTASFLTHRVQIQTLNQLQDVVLIGWVAQTNFQPFGLRLAWFGRIADDV